MKRKAEPASVEEEVEDIRTGDIIRKAANSASITSSSDQSERRRQWRKSDLDFKSGSASKFLGPMLEVIGQGKEEEMLTIMAGEHEDNQEVWRDCEKSGRKYRAFYHVDKVINGESQTYIERQILISKEGGDLEREDQEIIIAQRTYSTTGTVALKAHQLCFSGRIDLDRPYIFPKLGDEVPGVGFPDLHCTFRGIRDWHSVVRNAKFVGCDRTVSIDITRADIRSGREIIFDFEGDRVIDRDEKSKSGVQISCGDFQPWFDTIPTSARASSDAYPSPPSKRQKKVSNQPATKVKSQAKPTTIGMKLLGMGPIVEGTLRADLNINLVFKDICT